MCQMVSLCATIHAALYMAMALHSDTYPYSDNPLLLGLQQILKDGV